MSSRIAHNARWVIVSVSKPLMMRRSDDETWLLNPKRRYILNAEVTADMADYIETMSDLQSSTHYRPLMSATKVRLPHSSLLIERYRDRGIGDLLFTTGPLAYLNHITGGDIRTYLYAYAERGAVLNFCPHLTDAAPLVGPVLYDELPHFNYHWFVDTVTEYCEEQDQENVYDALFRSLGIDPASVDPKYKRPYAALSPVEIKAIDDFFFWVFQNTTPHQDLRKTGYYVVAPFSNSSLRSARYGTWIEIIRELSSRRPVLVVGAIRERMPTTDMAPGDFVNFLDSEIARNNRIINMLGKTSVRNLMQVIHGANCVLSMDSAALYIAQALRVPCVSLWGSHDPGVRLGYDRDYMDLAVWHQRACAHSPCYAWQGFPANKCPSGDAQQVCQCLAFIDRNEVVKRVDSVENRVPKLVKPIKSESASKTETVSA